MSDLVQRLERYGAPGRGSEHPQAVACREAAARITELEAALARSIAINERLLAIAGDVQHALKGGLRPPPLDDNPWGDFS